MERLTYEKSRSRWDEGRCPTKYTSRHTFQEVVARLAAYEDTGLGPETLNEFAPFLLEMKMNIGAMRRLKELLQSEKDGRLVVLPCKVGDTVYRVITTRDNDPIITEIKIKNLVQAADLIGQIGKKQVFVSWHLTREEAEAALKKRAADNEAD